MQRDTRLVHASQSDTGSIECTVTCPDQSVGEASQARRSGKAGGVGFSEAASKQKAKL